MIARVLVLAGWLRRHRELALLTVALALGVLAAVAARNYITGQIAVERERLVPAQRMVALVVAKRDLARGEQVSADTMAVREFPEAYAVQGAVAPAQFEAIAGASITTPMRAGDPLLHASLTSSELAGFSTRVREGIRAMTIAVDEVNAISGMLQPGDRIDLLFSARVPAIGTAAAGEVTRPLMQDLRVLATGRQVRPTPDDRNARPYTTITVEVQPIQAQRLVVAQRAGKLTALLRNPEDRETLAAKPMDLLGLLGLPTSEPAPVRRATELIVGGMGRPGLKSAPDDSRPVNATVDPPAGPTPPIDPSAVTAQRAPLHTTERTSR